MYVKATHGAVEEAPANPRSRGDRDTPTKAYEAPPGGDRAFLETMKSAGGDAPQGTAGGHGQGAYGDGEDTSEAGWVPGGAGNLNMPTLSPRGIAPGMSGMAYAPTQLPPTGPNQILSTMPIGKPDLASPPLLETKEKPGWQTSLDRALSSSGRFVEQSLQRFRAASQRTQLAIAIAVGGVVTVVLGLMLLWLLR
jgi:hypothetical protein